MRSTFALMMAMMIPALCAAQQNMVPSTSPEAAALPMDSTALAAARRYTFWLYQENVDSLLAHMSADERARPGARQQLAREARTVNARAGAEVHVEDERFFRRNGQRQYWRTAEFTNMNEPLLLRWVIDDSLVIQGLGMGPASQAPPVDHK